MKKSENGRSILEIIFVLFIITLILLAGLYLWDQQKAEVKAHAVTERLVTIKNNRRLSMQAHSEERMPRNEKGPHNTEFSVENGIDQQNSDWFWVTIKTEDTSLCAFLNEANVGADKIDDFCEKEGATTFYFKKNPQKTTTNTPEKNFQPQSCPANSICDKDLNTIGCEENYFLYNFNCLACPENSIECTNNNFECSEGYYKKDNTCQPCDGSIPECNPDENSSSSGSGSSGSNSSSSSSDPCKDINCGRHGTCKKGVCICSDNYYGEHCEISPWVCKNGGKWNTITYECECINGYTGVTCDVLNPCFNVNCGTHGTCSDGACICTDNYYGENCENAPLACQNGGSWNTTTHQCDCATGYTGNTCLEKESGTCTSYLDCKEGEYCQFSPRGNCETEPTSGVCQSVSDCGLYDINIGDGKKYTASNHGESCKPYWWTAKDICASLGMHMPSLSEVGCEDYKDDVCPTSGTVYGALKTNGLRNVVWTTDMYDSCSAWSVATTAIFNINRRDRSFGSTDFLCISDSSSCANVDCGDHGRCSNGACVCRNNYYGDRCQTAPLTCQNGGTWNTTTHVCDCATGFTGDTCGTKLTTNTCTDKECCTQLKADWKCDWDEKTCICVGSNETGICSGYGCVKCLSNETPMLPTSMGTEGICIKTNSNESGACGPINCLKCTNGKTAVCSKYGTTCFCADSSIGETWDCHDFDCIKCSADQGKATCNKLKETCSCTPDPCADFEPTVCRTACTNNNGTAEYTYAEEGTPCHENYDPSICLGWAQCPEEYSKACDGEGVCVQCPTNDNASSLPKWAAVASKLATGRKTPVKGCSCVGIEWAWNGSYCSDNITGGGAE
jgi:type II secretory pathway pseudopilin PulG